MRLPFLSLLLGALLLSTISACDDPSNIGIGLVDSQDDLTVRTFEPTRFAEASMPEVTGGASRILAGHADDPMLGTLSATGYIDFQSTFDSDAAVTDVELLLMRDYAYGDTVATVALNLYDLIEDWADSGAPADTSLPLGELVQTLEVQPADSLSVFKLPEEWIAANAETLTSDDFGALFHGFALEPAGGNAVLGFDATRSRMRVITDQDTSDFPVTQTISGLHREGTPAVPSDRLLIQDGTGPTLELNFDFRTDSLQGAAVNGAHIRLAADVQPLEDTPPNFVRPLLSTVQLVAVNADSLILLVAEAALTDEGYFVFDNPSGVSPASLRTLIQRLYLGEKLFERFELRVSGSTNTINPILLYTPEADASKAPAVVLTLTPPDR